jgi:hypothetical protein
VLHALERGRLLRLDGLLFAEATAFEDLHPLYAQACDFYRTLARDADRLRRLHVAIRELPAPEGPTWNARQVAHAHACRRALQTTYGPLGPLEDAWRRSAAAWKPAWFEDHRASERVGEEIVCAGFPGNNALLVSARPPPGAPFSLSLEVNVAPVGGGQADVCVGYEHRDDPRFLKLALGSRGFATLIPFSDGRWQERFRRNASLPPETFEAGTWVPVRVRVGPERLVVEVRGKPVLEAAVPPGFDALRGAWGLGATDSVARFREVRVALDG